MTPSKDQSAELDKLDNPDKLDKLDKPGGLIYYPMTPAEFESLTGHQVLKLVQTVFGAYGFAHQINQSLAPSHQIGWLIQNEGTSNTWYGNSWGEAWFKLLKGTIQYEGPWENCNIRYNFVDHSSGYTLGTLCPAMDISGQEVLLGLYRVAVLDKAYKYDDVVPTNTKPTKPNDIYVEMTEGVVTNIYPSDPFKGPGEELCPYSKDMYVKYRAEYLIEVYKGSLKPGHATGHDKFLHLAKTIKETYIKYGTPISQIEEMMKDLDNKAYDVYKEWVGKNEVYPGS